jgi:hypothetical protein
VHEDEGLDAILGEEEVDQAEAERLLKDRTRGQKSRELAAMVRVLERKCAAQDELLDRYTRLTAYAPKPFKIKKRTKKQIASGMNRAVAIALASDWHMEERVRPDAVKGLNSYTPEIAQERAGRFFQNFHRLIDIQRGGATIDTALLWLGGDFITGHIHPEFETENWLYPSEAIELVFDTLVSGIDYLLAHASLERLFIPTNHGNHGRTTEKMRVSSAAQTSYEWPLYRRLAKHYHDNPRVQFQIASGEQCWVELENVRLRFIHGHQIRYGGGIGSLSTPLLKKIARWDTQPSEAGGRAVPADYTFMGHLHTYMPGSVFGANGSLIGYGAFGDHIGAPYEDPQQMFCLADLDTTSTRRVVGHFPIRVTK